MNLQSQLRHLLTFLAGLGTLLLAHNLLAPDQAEALNQAGAALIEPLSVICGAVGAAAARLVLTWLGRMVASGAGETSSTAGSGMFPLWLIGATAAGLMVFSLPSCSSAQLGALRGVPIRGCVITDRGSVCYSSKTGVTLEVDAHSGK